MRLLENIRMDVDELLKRNIQADTLPATNPVLRRIIASEQQCNLKQKIESADLLVIRTHRINDMLYKVIKQGIVYGPITKDKALQKMCAPTLFIFTNDIDAWKNAANAFKNVKRIVFENYGEFTAEHNGILNDILYGIESVHFGGDGFNHGNVVNLLPFCSQIEHLAIETNIFKLQRSLTLNHMLEMTFPKLKILQLNYGLPDTMNNRILAEQMTHFLNRNCTIGNLKMKTNIDDSLHFIIENNIRLVKLSIRLNHSEMKSVIDLLNQVYNHGLTQEYDLIIEKIQILEAYADLNNNLFYCNPPESLYLNGIEYEGAENIPMMIFNNVKELHMKYISFEGANILSSRPDILSLEELYVESANIDIVNPLASQLPKLKKIAFIKANGNVNNLNWNFITENRTRFEGAVKLSIFVQESRFISILKTQIPFNMIEIKLSESLINNN